MTMPAGPVNEWRQLAAAAVLGAERVGSRLPPIGGRPGALLEADEPDAATGLLRSASVISVYARAGRRPAAGSHGPVAPCSDEGVPPCSLRAGQHLARILHGELGLLLDEWCELAAACGVRAPDELLPTLLDRMVAKPDEEGVSGAKVLGARGAWLAAMNANWKDAVRPPVNASDIWQTGAKAQRLAWLRRLRAAEPQAARELVSGTWAQEDADDRAAIVAVFASGLSTDDESLLETALDDGRKPVRQAAAELLARLPESAFGRRMRARAAALVRIELKKRLLRGGKLQIDVALPEKPDQDLRRDGAEYRRAGGMGERAYLLCQIVAATPLQTWEVCGARPSDIISAALETDWREPLGRGWTVAAARQRSAAWGEPLLRALLEAGDEADRATFQQLLSAFDPGTRERVLIGILREPSIPLSRSVPLLEYCSHAWSEQFSRAALSAMRSYFGTPAAYAAHALRNTVKQTLARYFSPAVATEAETGWSRTQDHWHQGDEEMVSTLTATLAFRRAMQEELSQ